MKTSTLLLFAIPLMALPGCATVFEGYYDTVELKNAPDSLQVFTAAGVEIPVEKAVVRERAAHRENVYESRPVTQIRLRSNLDPVLVLKSGGQEKRVQAFGKIRAGWYVLDLVFGFPWMVDALTGNWNSYDAIDASFK